MKESHYKALKILADGEYHSGGELGAALGVSRAAVSKQLNKLTDFGVELEPLKGKGYRIPGGLDLLDLSIVEEQLTTSCASQISELLFFHSIDSTNRQLMASIDNTELFSGLVCVAEQQTAGKGRRGRPWFTAYGQGLCFSIGRRFYGSANVIEGLSLAVGLSLVKAIENIGIEGLELKWPNDVLYQGKKLAGILIEMKGDLDGPIDIVLGIGLNIYRHDDQRIDQQWISLDELAPGKLSRSELLAEVLNQLLPMLANYESSGFAAFRAEWNRYDAFAGQSVKLLLGERVEIGVSRGVDSTGALLLESGDQLKAFSGGEISVRLNHDS